MSSPLNLESGIDYTRTDTSQKFGLGVKSVANDGCTYQYVRAGGAITANNFVTIDAAEGPYDVHHTSAVSQQIAGVAPVAISDNEFGWIKIRGKHASANVTTSAAAGAKLGTTATAGRLDALDVGAAFNQAELRAVLAAAGGVAVLCQTLAASNTATVVLL